MKEADPLSPRSIAAALGRLETERLQRLGLVPLKKRGRKPRRLIVPQRNDPVALALVRNPKPTLGGDMSQEIA